MSIVGRLVYRQPLTIGPNDFKGLEAESASGTCSLRNRQLINFIGMKGVASCYDNKSISYLYTKEKLGVAILFLYFFKKKRSGCAEIK